MAESIRCLMCGKTIRKRNKKYCCASCGIKYRKLKKAGVQKMENEKRFIDADALLRDNEEYLCKPCKEKGYDYHEVACRACWVDDMRIAIEDAPTVDAVEVVHARWIKGDGLKNIKFIPCTGVLYCSNCKNEAYWDTDYGQQEFEYCHNCGAKMDGDVNE